MLQTVEKMPTDGQFVAAWDHDGRPYSSTLKWVDGVLYIYDEVAAREYDPHPWVVDFDGAAGFYENVVAVFMVTIQLRQYNA